jgi:hypothetical protein
MMTTTSPYLGPAEIVSPAGESGLMEVRLLDGESVWARLALGIPYSPAVGDEVLVISQRPSESYVIGVLHGRGVTSLQVPGDLHLSAPHGTVRLTGDNVEIRGRSRVELTAHQATIRTARLNLFATTLVQRLTSAYTWVTGLLQFKGRRMRMVADEGWLVRAERAHLKTSGNTCINGKTIHLG